MRLANAASDAQAAYQAGLTSYHTNYNAAYIAAYNDYLGKNPNDPAGASAAGTAVANAAAASTGPAWTAGPINQTRLDNLPPVGTFLVTVSATNQTIDFGFDAGFVRNLPLVYEGPDGTSPAIVGLTVGAVYYVRFPTP